MNDVAAPDLGTQLVDRLNELSAAILASNTSDNSLFEMIGLGAPALDRTDLSNYALTLADKVRAATEHGIVEDDEGVFSDFVKRIDLLTKNFVPNLWNGHGIPASTGILVTLLAVDGLLTDTLRWPADMAQYAMPPKLAKRIRAAEARLADIEAASGDLDEKVKKILSAHDAADAFPADLESLKQAEARLKEITLTSEAALQTIAAARVDAEAAIKDLQTQQQAAVTMMKKCEDAFRVATSAGLAGAFQQRADNLNTSVRFWSGGLLAALAAGIYLGGERLAKLSELVSRSSVVDWGAIAMQLVLSVASIGAPIWLAWLSTKQIGQRFRLAEDYAFKASVAKAYEGYRRESAELEDPNFAARLFGVALERLEEAPLRLIANEGIHSTPLQELISSPAFKAALQTNLPLKERLAGILSSLTTKVPNSADAPSAPPIVSSPPAK